MISFNDKFKVLNIENKSIQRKDGNGTFDFTEVELETVDKKPTVLVARLVDKEMEVSLGRTYDMRIIMNSTRGRDGRVWNNFAIMAFKTADDVKQEASDYEPLADDDIPF